MNIPFLDLQRINARFESEFQQCLTNVLQAGWFLQGEHTQKFENDFAAYSENQYAVGVANGLDALVLILQAQKELAGWEDGDEVIVPSHTFVASALAIVQAKLTPILVDVHIDDFLLDAAQIEVAITHRTRAIMPVHLYGKCCDMESISAIACKHRLFVIEDAAQAHGATYQGRKVGSLGDAAAFSFYPGKNLGALGDGGAVVSKHTSLIRRVKILANYGAEHKYKHLYRGRNSRLDELQAAFLSVKLAHLDADNGKRQRIAQRYLSEIQNEHIVLPYAKDDNAHRNSVFHVFPILNRQREDLQSYLKASGIATLIHYPTPIHRQPAFQTIISEGQSFPNAEIIAAQELSLPISPVMREAEVDYVIRTLNAFSL